VQNIFHREFPKILLGATACLTALLFIVFQSKVQDRALKIYFLDIGQGDSIYIRMPDGKDMLVDGGPSSVVLQKLREVMPWFDREIDVLLETHPDADHIGGFPDVLKRYEVGLFIEPGIESKNAVDDEIKRILSEKAVDVLLARQGMRLNFGDGASFDILYPKDDVSRLSDTNAASIVGILSYGSTSVMLTGDAPKSIEDNILRAYDNQDLRSDLLKAGHHGSRTSSGSNFIRAVNPLFAIISAGKGNRYGHPHAEVIDYLTAAGASILKTYDSGTIGFISNGMELRLLK
jgi:competence protein ComEC